MRYYTTQLLTTAMPDPFEMGVITTTTHTIQSAGSWAGVSDAVCH
ncbi:MAG: hypothetical protein J07HQX50_02839 [Haloquadratum sp. J07HQX50]|nr:MAG: hypothetical protein J07HQX50_02839 [Haloquadratum sp. J07HQX50]